METVRPGSNYLTERGAGIGIQAAQLLSDSRSPLTALEQLSQNFPKYASSVARRVSPKEELKDEILTNARIAQPGINAIWLNGLQLQDTNINPLSYVIRIPFNRRGLTLAKDY